MAAADHEQDGIEVPDSVAAELRARGCVRASSGSEAAARKTAFLALTVRHRGASSVVFLVQVPGVIRGLARVLPPTTRQSRSCHVHTQTSLPSESAKIQNARARSSLTSRPPAARAASTRATASSCGTVRSR